MYGLSSNEKRSGRQRKNNSLKVSIIISLCMVISAVLLIVAAKILWNRELARPENASIEGTLTNGETIRLDYLTPNRFSRPQTRLRHVKGIVVHYTANPGTSAENNRNYFESLSWKKTTYASSHFIIGLEGEILQCIPLTEVSYASNNRNKDTISIECCHEDETGQFNEKTYSSLVALTAALCVQYDLDREDMIRHYDVTGKLCPLYYVEHEEEWEAFKDDVMNEVDKIQKQESQAGSSEQ